VDHANWPKYALAMLLKLQASRVVRTPWYLTLDADVVAVGDPWPSRLFDADGRAAYTPEPRHVHPHWWTGSQQWLGYDSSGGDGGFGVTPALLHVAGVQLVLADARQALRARGANDTAVADAMLRGWGDSAQGGWWSEYTLYRQALDRHGLFDALHWAAPLECASVWFATDGPWDVEAALADPACVWSVVQSSAGRDAADVARRYAEARGGDGGGGGGGGGGNHQHQEHQHQQRTPPAPAPHRHRGGAVETGVKP